MDKFIWIGITLALTVFAQLIVKARAVVHAPVTSGDKFGYLWAMYTDPGVLSGFFAGVLASVSWALALEKAGLAVAYPFMALSFVLTPVAASVLLHETLSVVQLAGLGLIVAGVTLSAWAA